jgi:hypothetical protein
MTPAHNSFDYVIGVASTLPTMSVVHRQSHRRNSC